MVSSAVCFSVDPSTPIIDHSIIFTCAMIVRDLKDYKERRESQGVWVLRAELKMEEEVRSLRD